MMFQKIQADARWFLTECAYSKINDVCAECYEKDKSVIISYSDTLFPVTQSENYKKKCKKYHNCDVSVYYD